MSNSSRSRGRFSATRKRDAVLRLLRGEDLDLVAREIGVRAPTLSQWKDAFLESGLAGLKTRPSDTRDERIEQLERKYRVDAADDTIAALNVGFDDAGMVHGHSAGVEADRQAGRAATSRGAPSGVRRPGAPPRSRGSEPGRRSPACRARGRYARRPGGLRSRRRQGRTG